MDLVVVMEMEAQNRTKIVRLHKGRGEHEAPLSSLSCLVSGSVHEIAMFAEGDCGFQFEFIRFVVCMRHHMESLRRRLNMWTWNLRSPMPR